MSDGDASVLMPLIGQVFPFSGVCGKRFKLGDTVYEAVEDESDGYRSYLGSINVSADDTAHTFFFSPIATVRLEDLPSHTKGDGWSFSEAQEGFQLVDITDGHVWLEVGTRNTDDYYPYFLFLYFPKATDDQAVKP